MDIEKMSIEDIEYYLKENRKKKAFKEVKDAFAEGRVERVHMRYSPMKGITSYYVEIKT